MKRLKRGVAWLMAICLLNMGGVFNGFAVNAEDSSAQSTGYTLAFSNASMDASGNGTVSVAVTVGEKETEVILPSSVSGSAILAVASKDASGNVVSSDSAAAVSADATYQITNVAALNVSSGNALKVVGFEGAVPTLANGVDVSPYYVKVASGNASSDAYQALASSFTGANADKLRVVVDVTKGLLRVENPTQYKSTLAELASTIKVYNVLDDTTVQNPAITWYTDDTYTTALTTTDCVSGTEYYYEVTADGYNAYRSSVSVTSNAKEYTSGNCTLTLELTEASGNATGTATITKAVYADDKTYSAADIYSIPETVTIDGKTYQVTGIGKNAFDENCCFTSYYIPTSVKTIDANAFYRVNSWNNEQNQGAAANSVLLLRFAATTADDLPEFSSQLQNNNGNLGFVVSNSIAENDRNNFENKLKNDKNAGNGSVYYVENPATDKILKQGNVTPSSQKALYTDHLNVITLTAQGFKDFQTQADVLVTANWNEPDHAFSFAEGAAAFPYHCDATGYASYQGTINITPYAASGFTYRLADAGLRTLFAAGYDGTATVVTVPDTETDATGAVYTVTGISSEFQNNTVLEEITLGANIATVQDMAFGGCSNMAIKVVDANTSFKSVNGFLYSKDGTILIAAPSARSEVFLPEGTLVIGNYAFYHNSKIQTLVIPASIVKVGEDKNASCFESCSNLDTIKFCSTNPAATMTITSSFSGALKNIYVPTGTTATYEALFKGYNIWYNNATFKEWTPTTSKLVTLNDYNEMEIAPTDTTKTYTWKSDNEAIVVVVPSGDTKSAKIHATAATGIATVTAVAADGTSTSWQVTVAIDASLPNPWAVPQYTLKASKSSVTMGVKSGKKADSAVLTITASDKSAVTVQSAVSSNKKVATVSKSGNKITITSAAKKGTATITVTDKNGKTVKVKVTTKAAPKKVKLKKSSIKLKKNKTYAIALKNTVSAKVTYKTSNKKVATVSETGLVTAKKKGSCKITVTTYNGKHTRLKVRVK